MARQGGRNARQGWSPSLGRDRRPGAGRAGRTGGGDWIWGVRPVLAALANVARAPARQLVATADRARHLGAPDAPEAEILPPGAIAALLPAGAVHQGIALLPGALAPTPLEALADPAAGVLIMLDQVTDPQNVGAVLRSAAAFGARGLIVQDRHTPQFSGVVAKAAAGALDALPHARETNLARALDRLSDLGWRAVGLAEAADQTLEEALDARPTVLVLGSEGEGLRRLVGEHCDALARLPTMKGLSSLNVAAAAAVALYETARRKS